MPGDTATPRCCSNSFENSSEPRSAYCFGNGAQANIVAAGLARQCQIQVAYAIGVARPMNITVYTEGTGKISDARIAALVNEHFDLRPKGIVTMLDLLKPRAIVRKDHARSNSALDRIDAALKEAVLVAERITQGNQR